MTAPSSLGDAIESIEAGYEFLLAYAAQGFEADQGGQHGEDARKHLNAMADALAAVDSLAREATGSDAGCSVFLDTLAVDAERAAGVVQLVLTRGGISSQLIDNFNASSHIRTLLTDLFLLDEARK